MGKSFLLRKVHSFGQYEVSKGYDCFSINQRNEDTVSAKAGFVSCPKCKSGVRDGFVASFACTHAHSIFCLEVWNQISLP